MAAKKVAMTSKPQREKAADNFVSGGAAVAKPAGGKLKRLTIDLEPEMHRQLKVRCAQTERTMAEEVRAMLREHLSS